MNAESQLTMNILLQIDTGKVTIEGCLSEDYYKVRELLYEQYAII